MDNNEISKLEQVLDKLEKNGFRITPKRKLLVEVILSGEYTCPKEIHYYASLKDPMLGIATVYRMVQILENLGVISRKNMYTIQI